MPRAGRQDDVSVDPGMLDRMVTVQKIDTTTKGVSGATIHTWTTLARVAARKDDLQGRERYQFGQETAPFDTRWIVHYFGDLDPELVDVAKTRRLVYEGRTHDIVFARHLGRRAQIEVNTVATGKVA